MKIILQTGLIFFICLIGEFISAILPIPIPSSILSMVLLFILLLLKLIRTEHIKEFSEFLLNNMAFLFIPAGVGVMEYFPLIKECILPFIIICLISTLITFFVTIYTIKAIIYVKKKSGEK